MSACFCNKAVRSPFVIQEETATPDALLLLLLLPVFVSVFLSFEQFDCTDNRPNNKNVHIKKFNRIKFYLLFGLKKIKESLFLANTMTLSPCLSFSHFASLISPFMSGRKDDILNLSSLLSNENTVGNNAS